MSELVRHDMPNGMHVYYRDSDHAYFRETNGERGSGRLTGVSTVVAPYDSDPGNLLRWAARMTTASVAELAADGLSQEDVGDMRAALRWLESGETITEQLTAWGLAFWQARDKAGARGTNVHKHALQALAEGQQVPAFDEMTEEEQGYARGVLAFWHECEPTVYLTEHVVADLELGIAGRLDLVAESDRWVQPDGHGLAGVLPGERILLDAKTSGFIPTKHHVQIAGYAHCASVSGFGEVESTAILQVFPDGSYLLIPGHADAEDFKAAVSVYRRSARIGTAARASRKAMA